MKVVHDTSEQRVWVEVIAVRWVPAGATSGMIQDMGLFGHTAWLQSAFPPTAVWSQLNSLTPLGLSFLILKWQRLTYGVVAKVKAVPETAVHCDSA